MKITIGKKIALTTDLPESETSETQIQSTFGGEEKISLQDLPLLLYVEDDDISQRVVGRFLQGICKLEFAKTGQDALELANKTLYKGFLVDIHLCGMDGVQVTEELRKLPQYAATPIIAVTACAMGGDKEKFIEAGCTDYISKPFSKDELITLIKKYFRK
ncbi:MAG: response regulator [Ignavibacteriaceae bacterium]|jgi:two-component system sensor histidine kinase BarA